MFHEWFTCCKKQSDLPQAFREKGERKEEKSNSVRITWLSIAREFLLDKIEAKVAMDPIP